VLADDDLITDDAGNFEIILSPQESPGNWLALDTDSIQITTRHYYETPISIAADPAAAIPLTIEPLTSGIELTPITDITVAERIRRVADYVRAMTLGMPLNSSMAQSWVSRVPNVFNKPARWGNKLGYGNLAAHYCMAPFVVMPGQALVIKARFPDCRFANVMLWNRFLQTFDYVNRSN